MAKRLVNLIQITHTCSWVEHPYVDCHMYENKLFFLNDDCSHIL